MNRFIFAVWLGFLVGACGGDEVVDARGKLRVLEDVLEFPRTFVGYPTHAELLVDNSGRASLQMGLEVPEPFAVDKAEQSIGAGGGHRIRIGFSPTEVGTYHTTMRVRLPHEDVEVRLIASAVAAPHCSAGPCADASFDPVEGVCRSTPRPERAPCTTGNICQVDEQCIGGSCVGKPLKCGEDDECTTHVCDQNAGGCIEIDTSSRCPTPEHPCKVADCFPTVGCVIRNADDGTPCGTANCRLAHVCVGGDCEGFQPLDGTPCNASCGPGQCQSQECKRKEGETLTLTARYQAAEGRSIVFDGITDWAGMSFWVECAENIGCELVSITPSGFRRWDEAVPLPFLSVREGATVALGNRILVAGQSEAAVVSHSSVDGGREWLADLRPLLPEAGFSCPCALSEGVLTTVGEGGVLFSAEVENRSFLALLAAEDGKAIWKRGLVGRIQGERPIADADGNLYFLLGGGAGGPMLISLSAAGDERWRRDMPDLASIPVAVADGRVVLATSRLLSSDDGAALPLDGGAATELALGPLVGPDGGFFFYEDFQKTLLVQSWNPISGEMRPAVEAFPPQPGSPAPRTTSPLLTHGRGALFSSSVWAGSEWHTELVEIRADGQEARRCTVPGPLSFSGTAALRANGWMAPAGEKNAELRIFALPPSAGELSGSGWVGPSGNPMGGGKPW